MTDEQERVFNTVVIFNTSYLFWGAEEVPGTFFAKYKRKNVT